jgi:hypothetical protein
MWAPKLAVHEALQVEAKHFVDCVTRGTRPQSDGEAGLRVVRLLEAASESMQQHGRPVDISAVAKATARPRRSAKRGGGQVGPQMSTPS